MSGLGMAAAALVERVNAAVTPDQLDGVSKACWISNGDGDITDDEASLIASAIEQRRPAKHEVGCAIGVAANTIAPRLKSRFSPRQRPRSADRQASRDRRRTLGGSSALPPNLRHHFTEGQRAVLCVISGEVKHHGVCDMPIDKIAALAGVCRTTVQTALHEARRLGHIRITSRPQPGRKNLSNLVEIVSPEWRMWIRRGPSAHRPIGSKFANLVSPTKRTDQKEKRLSRKEGRRRPYHEASRRADGPPAATGRTA